MLVVENLSLPVEELLHGRLKLLRDFRDGQRVEMRGRLGDAVQRFGPFGGAALDLVGLRRCEFDIAHRRSPCVMYSVHAFIIWRMGSSLIPVTDV